MMNNIIYFFIFLFSIQFNSIKPDSTATVDGLKKLITTFAQEDKAYITLYAVELSLSYDNYLSQRRKQYCVEIKHYADKFSSKLTSEMLAGKIEQDKLDWVNNICPGVLPQASDAKSSTDTLATASAQNTKNNSATTSITPSPSAATTSLLINKNTIKDFHAIKVD